jgi:type IV secretory pathway TraG/TraD family ATPase VirD4
MSDRLGTAQWEAQSVVSSRYPFTQGKFWLGRAEDDTSIGYRDDRHICLVSGTRGGKGTSIIVNNLCFWPGSAVVVDPKGENATVTAARRGRGSAGTAAKHNIADGSGTGRYRANVNWTDYSDGTNYPPMQGEASGDSDGSGTERYSGRGYGPEHCEGLGQAVHVLDPFKAAQVDEAYNSCFNPLADLDPQSEETIDEASRLANAIIVVNDAAPDPYWDEAARAMVKGLILHVLTTKQFTDDERNLITVRKLIQRGAWEIAEAIREDGHDEDKIDPPHLLLWRAMEMNEAFEGTVAGIGAQLRSLMASAPKMFQGVLQGVATQTEFLDSPGMRRVLARSDFKLSELKTRPEGMTLYLSLPQRYMDTHYRWLRMMVALTTTEMEITRGQPASGHPVLMVLDEFAGLKRMTAIENAVAQIAGFGVKLFFVLQSLEQLKLIYKDGWETFLANAGLKIFFSIDDHFTRDYISKLAGETEIIREVQSFNESEAESRSFAEGTSQSRSVSQSTTHGTSQSATTGTTSSRTYGTSQSTNQSRSEGVNRSRSLGETFGTSNTMGWSSGVSSGVSGGTGGLFGSRGPKTVSSGLNSSVSGSESNNRGASHGSSDGTSSSFSRGSSDTASRSETYGRSDSRTAGSSDSETEGWSETTGTSQTRTQGTSRTSGTGKSETLHRRPLIQPDEVGRFFTRIDDRNHPAYPGLALVMVTGANPLVVTRAHYFEDQQFIDCFSPHPDHKFMPALPYTVEGLQSAINDFQRCINYDTLPDGSPIEGSRELVISRWLIKPGSVTRRGQAALRIDGLPPDGRSVHVLIPCSGKVTKTAAAQNRVPDGELFTLKVYDEQFPVDPFAELSQARDDARMRFEQLQRETKIALRKAREEAETRARKKARARSERDGPWVSVALAGFFLAEGIDLFWLGVWGAVGGALVFGGALVLNTKYGFEDFLDEKFSEKTQRIILVIFSLLVPIAFGWVFAFAVSIVQGVWAQIRAHL